MEKDGLSVDDIFCQCAFRQDERDMVLRAVHIVQPDYHPNINTSTDQLNGLPALVQDYYMQVLQAVCNMGCFLSYLKLLFRMTYSDAFPNNSSSHTLHLRMKYQVHTQPPSTKKQIHIKY